MMSAYEKVSPIIHFPLLFWYQSYTVLYAFSRSSHCASRFGPSEVNSSQGRLKSLERTSMKNFALSGLNISAVRPRINFTAGKVKFLYAESKARMSASELFGNMGFSGYVFSR